MTPAPAPTLFEIAMFIGYIAGIVAVAAWFCEYLVGRKK